MTTDPDHGREPPLHLRLSSIGLVAGGGTVGTLLRAGSTKIVTTLVAGPLVAAATTMIINIVGAFALGWLLAALARHPDTGRRRHLRLLLGTGLLGGFTTYSALAVDVARLGGGAAVGTAVLLGAATLLIGLGAAALGTIVGHRTAGAQR